MTRIHMDTEQARLLGRALCQTGDVCYDFSGGILTALAMMDWQGASREYFETDARQIINNIRQLAEQLETLGVRLENEVCEWEDAARSFTRLR